MKKAAILTLMVLSFSPLTAADKPILEYRMMSKAGETGESLVWADSEEKISFEKKPFLTMKEISEVKVEPANQPQKFEIELSYTKDGKKKLEKIYTENQGRSFC